MVILSRRPKFLKGAGSQGPALDAGSAVPSNYFFTYSTADDKL